jgi:excisionase family DNA binding protein
MTLPEKALFSTIEAAELLSLSSSSIRRLIDEGQLSKVYPRPRSMRITRESLAAHLERSVSRSAVVDQVNAKAQAKEQGKTETKKKRLGGLLERWGLAG